MDRSRLRARVTELAGSLRVPGVQVAVHHDGETWHWEHGVARWGDSVPLDATDAVPSGSLTKLVTAATALGLAEDGDIDLDDPLVDQVPGLAWVPRALTPRHLLAHVAGLPSDGPDVGAASSRRYLADTCRSVSVGVPGRRFSYSNLGYLLVGALIEAATGLAWAEAVGAVVLTPLGIPTRTTGRVSGHSVGRSGERVLPVAQSLTPVEAPAGALALSAAEWAVVGRALSGHEDGPLGPDSLKRMSTPVAGADPFGLADGWGLGLAVYGKGDGVCVGHDGNGDGTSVHLRVNPATGTVVALAANASTGFALWRALAPDLPSMGLPITDHNALAGLGEPVAPPEAALGDFANGDVLYRVRRAGHGLRLTVDSEPFADLTVHKGLGFSMRDCDSGEVDQAGRFVLGPTGGVDWVRIGGRLAHRVDHARAVA